LKDSASIVILFSDALKNDILLLGKILEPIKVKKLPPLAQLSVSRLFQLINIEEVF
jgi:hypothetical protein